SMLTAEATSCYTCTGCSVSFMSSEVTTVSGCNYCAKTVYPGLAIRSCLPSCIQASDSFGNVQYCCDGNLCNSGERLRGLSWLLLLLPAAALAAISCRQ
ncbi:hypothetical protein BOX15_Mlig025981g1, partial [Macrostomum lignano]